MTAEYYYNKMMEYNSMIANGLWYGSYSSESISINKIKDNTYVYVLYPDKNVIRRNTKTLEEVSLTLSDLKGNNFEIFNYLKVFKVFYLTPEEKHLKAKYSIYDVLHKLVSYVEEGKDSVSVVSYDKGPNDNITGFTYVTSSQVYVVVSTIKSICVTNNVRRKFGALCYPFDRKHGDYDALHITLFLDRDIDVKYNIYRKCDNAMKDLQQMFSKLGIESSIEEVKMDKPISI